MKKRWRFAELLPDSESFWCSVACAEPCFRGSRSFVEPRKTFGKTYKNQKGFSTE
jgi:hypothetical protein